MISIKNPLFAVLLLATAGLSAQTPLMQTDRRYIEVLGSSEMDLQPDIIVLSIRLKEYEQNREKVLLEKIEKDFLASVAKSNIPKENIRISDLSLTAIQRGRKDLNVFSEKTYDITFSKTEDALKLLDNSKDLKLDNLEILRLSHTQIQKYRLDVKVDALKAAETKADALLKAVGSRRGKVLLVNENTEALRQPDLVSNSMTYYNGMGKVSTADQMLVKSINLRYEVLVRFEIE